MKINILGVLLILFPFFSYSQKQGNIWYFGNGDGLDFNNGTPVLIIGGQTGSDVPYWDVQEGTACISDSSGHLLFYTGGERIWNRNHQAMSNGIGIMGGSSSSQSSIIVPLPGSNSIYYVFTSDEFQSYDHLPLVQKGYRYSVVDMCLNDTLGDVIPDQKNILLLDSSAEKLAACEDASGGGYWIIGHKMFSDEFRVWHLTAAGITNTVISHIGSVHGWYDNMNWSAGAQGQIKFNPQGSKLAVAMSNIEPGILELFDFNNSTGVISNMCHIDMDNDNTLRIYGLEFSPDGTKLYAPVTGFYMPKRLFQFDLTAGGGACDSIMASRVNIFQSNTTAILWGMQLAPDGKIYVVCNSYFNLGCVNSPNLSGLAANFDSSAIELPQYNGYTLPAFIAGYKYHNQLACSDYIPQEIVIPNVFTPNGDGANDLFEIMNLPASSCLTIYNRWGNKVYETGNYKNDWDADKRSAGIYYYLLSLPNNVRSTGFVEVIK